MKPEALPRVLVDTSVWIEFFNRPASAEATVLGELIEQDMVVLAGVVIAEIIQGVRSKEERELLEASLSVLPFIEDDREDWVSAGRLLAELRIRGIAVPITDAILAQLCLRHDLAIYTLDNHFDHFPKLKQYTPKD